VAACLQALGAGLVTGLDHAEDAHAAQSAQRVSSAE
jgi:hypothetical protein